MFSFEIERFQANQINEIDTRVAEIYFKSRNFREQKLLRVEKKREIFYKNFRL